MTKKELQDFYNINTFCEEEYLQMLTKKWFYERHSKEWKPFWKRAKNALRKYGCKLVHHGDFGINQAYYHDAINRIAIMPPAVFIEISDNALEGLFTYYAVLWHEIFHCILHHEFHSNILLRNEAEEMIVEEAVRDIVIDDLCPLDDKTHEMNDFLGVVSYNQKLKDKCNEYIQEYEKRLYYNEEDMKMFNLYKEHIKRTLKKVYEECK